MKTTPEQILEAINNAKHILITFNRAWPGDAVASALAMRLWLLKLGKTADIAAEKPSNTSSYSFLPGFALIKPQLDNLRKFIISLDISNAEVAQIEYQVDNNKLDFIVSPKNGFFAPKDISSRSSGFKYDLVITLSTPDFESLGTLYDHDTEFFFDTTVINIDHQASNDNYGQINLVTINAVATAEILYELFKESKTELDADIATCLLAGLISETKSFKTANVTPRTLTIASALISKDGRREEIINALYRSRQMNVLKLWGSALMNLQSAFDNRIIWSTIKPEDFIATETKPSDLHDVVDELIVSMPQAQVIVLGYETTNEAGASEIRAVVHSVKNFDALYLVQPAKADGTRANATIVLATPLLGSIEALVASIEAKMRRLES